MKLDIEDYVGRCSRMIDVEVIIGGEQEKRKEKTDMEKVYEKITIEDMLRMETFGVFAELNDGKVVGFGFDFEKPKRNEEV